MFEFHKTCIIWCKFSKVQIFRCLLRQDLQQFSDWEDLTCKGSESGWEDLTCKGSESGWEDLTCKGSESGSENLDCEGSESGWEDLTCKGSESGWHYLDCKVSESGWEDLDCSCRAESHRHQVQRYMDALQYVQLELNFAMCPVHQSQSAHDAASATQN